MQKRMLLYHQRINSWMDKKKDNITNQKSTRNLLKLIAGSGLFIVLSLALAKVWPWGSDFYYFYYPTAKVWLNGHHAIYDGISSQLFYPPWILFLIVPLGLFPIEIAHGFQLTGSIIFLIFSLRLLTIPGRLPLYFILISALNMHSFHLYICGQIDMVLLLGISLGYWALQNRKPTWLSLGICLMVMKPPMNVFLTLLLFLISIRGWNPREIMVTILGPSLMVVISSFAVGLDWPAPFFQNMVPRLSNVSITLWRIADMLHLPKWIIGVGALFFVLMFLKLAWKERTNMGTLSISLATTFVFTIYANNDHYILLLPALFYLLQHSKMCGLIAYLMTFIPLCRLVLSPEACVLDIAYPIFLLAAAYYFHFSIGSHSKLKMK